MTKIVSITAALLVTTTISNAANIEVSTSSQGTPIVTISGAIEAGDDTKFARAATFAGRAFVYLNSPGGLLEPGLAIAKRIAALPYETVVTGKCASMCALIWLSGRKQYVFSKASIGFHGVYLVDEAGKIRGSSASGNALVGAFLARLGYSDHAIERLTDHDPHSFLWLDSAAVKELGINATILPSKN